MKRILSILVMTIMSAVMLLADEVTFEARAPKQVILGKPFQLTYSVNQRAKDLRAPEMVDFDILAGPYTSQSSSTQFINGQRTSSFSLTFTYTLMARKEGTFTIQPATIIVGHDSYTSNGVRITVLPADEQPAQQQQAPSQPQQVQRQQSQGSSSNVSGDNIFVRTIANKTRVHEQECILLQYKLYVAGVDFAQFSDFKIPEYKGFLKQDLDQTEAQWNLEHYNGRNYQTAVFYQTLLFPQKAGDIQIDPAQFEAILRVQTRQQVRSIFDDFFGTYTNVSKALTAPGTTIHVEALPSGKPSDYTGGVGRFQMNSSITTTELQTNEAVTLKIEIAGSGNMKLLKTPAVDWPEGFEVYDPKVSNNFKNTPSGVSGNKTIEYLVIPRAAGEYEIPAVTMSYFDTQEGQYKTLSTPTYTLHVARGANETESTAVVSNYVGKEDIKQLGDDIRYIYTGRLKQTKNNGLSMSSILWWLWYLIPLLLAVVLFILFRKRIRENADVQRVRYKKANKVAQKRLKAAAKLLKENQASAFYEEIERAAWSYLSDRLSIPTAQLGKDNIAQILAQKGVGEDLIKEVNHLLTTAEFARYAPSQSDHAMQDLYEATATLIDKLENQRI